MSSTIIIDNVRDKESVYQRCLLVSGRCEAVTDSDGSVDIVVLDESGKATIPKHSWPMCQGFFKALVILTPGENLIRVSVGKEQIYTTDLSVRYTPLLQTPPLHLAILVAKDSPLMIDCPSAKFGYLSSAHSSLDAAIEKFRVTAYMWQALTAEEMRKNGFGRRTFRLEEEWAPETLSRAFSYDQNMQTTAKVHLVRSDMTVAELRDADIAQQNSDGNDRDQLHNIFTEALLAHGVPFTREAKPIVAGLILDSHYDVKKELITAHAALGAHNPNSLSLGIFGSHLTYSWPRFMEEIPECLLDIKEPGDQVGNDNGECASMWEACSVGQGAFLHEVGHAFSAPHTTGIMARGYSKDWPKCFLSKTAYSRQKMTDGISPVSETTPNECHWDIRDLLRFRNLAHFRLPADTNLDKTPPEFRLEDENGSLQIIGESKSGIARIMLDGTFESTPTVGEPLAFVKYAIDSLESRFDRGKPLELEVFSINGKQKRIDVWKFLRKQSFIPIPGSSIVLKKKGVVGRDDNDRSWSWNVLLKKRGADGELHRASHIDVKVGCGLDGAIVHYKDGSSTPCGYPDRHNRRDYGMGGHQSCKLKIPDGVGVAKVAVATSDSWDLGGLRLYLTNGKAAGALNKDDGNPVETLTPEKGQRIVGFYGTSGKPNQMCSEFGIITAPTDQELPDSIYELPELQNNPEPEKDEDSSDSENESNDSNDSDSDSDSDS